MYFHINESLSDAKAFLEKFLVEPVLEGYSDVSQSSNVWNTLWLGRLQVCLPLVSDTPITGSLDPYLFSCLLRDRRV